MRRKQRDEDENEDETEVEVERSTQETGSRKQEATGKG